MNGNPLLVVMNRKNHGIVFLISKCIKEEAPKR